MSQVVMEKALANVASDFAAKVESIRKYALQVEDLENAGFPVEVSEWKMMYMDSIRIDRSELSQLRKAVGPLRVHSKYAPSNYETSKELIVTVKPTSERFSELMFNYRSPFRGGGKCHVETVTSTYKTLVCKA